MMKLTFINVGYGEAILIECQDKLFENGTFTMLIDAGSSETDEYTQNITGRIPAYKFLSECGVKHIDIMVSTHIHEDHLCGLLPVAKNIIPKQYWQTLPGGLWREIDYIPKEVASTVSMQKQIKSINDYRNLCNFLKMQGVQISQVFEQKSILPLCQNLTLEVLAPSYTQVSKLEYMVRDIYKTSEIEAVQYALGALDSAMNNYSLIFVLEYEGVRILLPGDTNRDGYTGIEEKIKADIFKVGHHSQIDGISLELLKHINPSHVVSCASSDRRFGSAHPDILQMIYENNAKLFFSDCPDVLPYTKDLLPHKGVEFSISDGEINAKYLIC